MLPRVKLRWMYEGNPGEIDLGSSEQGFELTGVNCNSAPQETDIQCLVKKFYFIKSECQ